MHVTAINYRRQELTFFDEKSARSLVNLLPEAFGQMLRHLWNSDHAHLLSLSESSLRRELRRRDKNPGPLDEELRFKFWIEFERVQDEMADDAKMNVTRILGRRMPKEAFYKYYLPDQHKLAWLLCPPSDYVAMLEMNLRIAQERVTEILELPLANEATGFIHEEVIDRILKIADSLHVKVLGGTKRNPAAGLGRDGRKRKEEDEPPEVNRHESDEDRAARLEAEFLQKQSEKAEL